MKLLVVGTGYVGLVSGACLAEMGHVVTCLDINQEKIEMLKRGKIPIYEPGLEEIVCRNLKAKRLHFTTSFEDCLNSSEVCFLAVNTPMGRQGNADLSMLENAAKAIAEEMTKSMIVVIKSTVPVGTAFHIKNLISDVLQSRGVNLSFSVVSNPEFLKEGNAIQDFMKPDRIIIGVEEEEVRSIMKKIYAPFMFNHERLIAMDILSAEMTKYAANAMLATRISFMNELASLCEKNGANINQVRQGLGSDTRIGYQYLYPGIGFGGSCLPKDIAALREQAKSANVEMPILNAVEEINKRQKTLLGEKILTYFSNKGGIKGKTIGILGVAFKPETDDIREASSLILIKQLLDEGAFLRVYDPVAIPNAKQIFSGEQNITWCESEKEAAENASAVALVTEWKQFRFLNLSALLLAMEGNVFFDGRNQYQPQDMIEKGFTYISIGNQPAYSFEEAEIQ